MPHFIIFGSVQQGNRLSWPNIVGVFQAPSADLACRAAAKRQGTVGTYFAVEGVPWGIALDEVAGVSEIGREKGWGELERERQELELELLRKRSGRGRLAELERENDRAFDQVERDLEEIHAADEADEAERRGEIEELEPS